MKNNYAVELANEIKRDEISGAHRNIKYDFYADGIEVFSEYGKIYVLTESEKIEYASERDAVADADALVSEWKR